MSCVRNVISAALVGSSLTDQQERVISDRVTKLNQLTCQPKVLQQVTHKETNRKPTDNRQAAIEQLSGKHQAIKKWHK